MDDDARDEMLIEMRNDIKHLVSQGNDQETRVRSLESSRSFMSGVAAVLTAAWGFLLKDVLNR